MGIGFMLVLIALVMAGAISSMIFFQAATEENLAQMSYETMKTSNISHFEKNIKDFYSENYDLLHLPPNKFINKSIGTESILDSFIKKYKSNDYPFLFSKNRVCVNIDGVEDNYKCEFVTDQRCLVFGEGEKDINGINICNELSGNEIAKNTMLNLLKTIPTGIYVSFDRTTKRYGQNQLPVMVVNVYKSDNFYVDFNNKYNINLETVVDDKILEARDIMHKIYEMVGERTKRNWKGYVKKYNVTIGNPFSALGDSLDKREYVFKRLKKNATTIKEIPYEIVGTELINGFMTSPEYITNMRRVDSTTWQNIFTKGKCVVKDKFLDKTIRNSNATYLSKFYYVFCEDVPDFRKRLYDGELDLPTIPKHLRVKNFCLSTEPCFIEYNKDVKAEVTIDGNIHKANTLRVDEAIRKYYLSNVNDFLNPFYPNAFLTLDKTIEGNGFIVSSNNNALGVEDGLYKLLFGMKFIPVEFYDNEQKNYRHYIINTYSLQNK